jgi:hypothetical protein
MTPRFSNNFWRLTLLALLAVSYVGIGVSDGSAKTSRSIGLFPNLLDSPVQPFESRMMNSPVEYFESRMLNSPAQLIGSPFGPYRFATLPSAVELWTTRRSVGWLPAMLQTSQGMLLLLPPYVLPRSMWFMPTPTPVVYAEAPDFYRPRQVPSPKFITLHCGRYIEITNSTVRSLRDSEEEPCQ